MKVLDLFCGLGGWTKGFKDIFPNAEYYGIDITKLNYPEHFIQADILDWIPDQHYDIVLASPPCTEFSIAKKWGWGTQDERIGLDLIFRTFWLIQEIKPKYYVIENVKGLTEFLPKPTDIIKYNRHKDGKTAYLWSNIGSIGFLESMINYRSQSSKKNKKYMKLHPNYKPNKRKISTCKTQPERALIPLALSHAVAKKIEQLELKQVQEPIKQTLF